jgi:glycosyltransferase involved in cell wall biosynthesis
MRISCILGPYQPIPPVRGGAVERTWQNLCVEFARMGHNVTLISRRFRGLENDETRDGVRYIRVPSIDAPRSKLLYRIFDVVYAGLACAVLPLSDVTITNSVALPLIIPRARAGKIYVNINRFPKGQMALYKRADRLQAVSQAVADAILQQSPSVFTRVKVVPNALSATFTRMRTPSRGTRVKEILYVGRIAREKGLDLLVRAFQQVQNRDGWRLTLLGPSDIAAGADGVALRSELETHSRLAQGRIHFEDPIFDETALAQRLHEAEIFVYPSVAEQGEALPMAPLEAMACGCAVIVSGLACFRDYIVDGSNALVFDHRNSGDTNLARVLEKLMNAEDLRHALGSAAIRTSQDFDAKRVAPLFISDFCELIACQTNIHVD